MKELSKTEQIKPTIAAGSIADDSPVQAEATQQTHAGMRLAKE